MTGERWREVKAITADALGVTELDRAGFIASRCGADQALCREVQSLVAAALKATDLFEHASAHQKASSRNGADILYRRQPFEVTLFG